MHRELRCTHIFAAAHAGIYVRKYTGGCKMGLMWQPKQARALDWPWHCGSVATATHAERLVRLPTRPRQAHTLHRALARGFTVHNTGKRRAATASPRGNGLHHRGLSSRRQEAQIINACGKNALADRISCRNGQDHITKKVQRLDISYRLLNCDKPLYIKNHSVRFNYLCG
jgi:hypothetical protein